MVSPELNLRLPSSLEQVHDDELADAGLRLWVKRDDLIHADLPGNKWRKLKYNLQAAADQGHHTLLTFGGAYSNHIRATAAAGAYFGLGTIGVIRGEPHEPLNWSLSYAVTHGMRLRYLDREAYRRKSHPGMIDGLHRELGEFYLLPEGGSNELAVQGCMDVPAEIEQDFDVICCPCGTGGTLAGIAAGLRPGQRAIGFSALKGGEFLSADVERLQKSAAGAVASNWHIEYDFHFGGYARTTPELAEFIERFEQRHGLRLDWIYVAKMMYGIFAMARHGAFPPGTRLIAVITGPAEPMPGNEDGSSLRMSNNCCTMGS
jgi:1-aminocyclopropane-1-carboxylate deaminase